MGTVGTSVGTIAKHVGTVGTVETEREIIGYFSLLQFPRFPQFPRLLQQFPHRFPRFHFTPGMNDFMLWSTLPTMLFGVPKVSVHTADKRCAALARG